MNEMSLFLVRVWQRDGGFHSAVRGVGQEQPVHFDDARPLAEFLAQAAPARRADPPGEPGAAPTDAPIDKPPSEDCDAPQP